MRPGEAGREGSWEFLPNIRPHPETTGQHLWPDIAALPDGTVGLAWMSDHEAGGYHIYYCGSTDGGRTWSSPERVDDRTTGSYSKFVSLAFTPSGVPVAVWEDDRTSGVYNLWFSKRVPGSGWTANARINTMGSPPSGGDYMNPGLAILDEDRWFVAWTDWREGVYHQVYFRGTWNGGGSWGPENRISDEIGYLPVAGDPCLIVDPQASGETPESEVLYCVMNDWRGNVPGGRYPEVYFSRSLDGGAHWSNGVRVNDYTDYYQQVSSHALVLLDDGTLTAGWMNNHDFTQTMYRTCVSTDQGVTWGASVRVDDPALGGTGTYSSIAAWSGTVFAVFDSYQGNWNAWFRASWDGGRSWNDPVVRVDDDDSGAATSNPVLAASNGLEVCAAWSDSRPGSGPWKIYTSVGEGTSTGIDDGDGGPLPPGAQSAGAAWSGGGWIVVPNPSTVGREVRLRRVGAGSGRDLDGAQPGPEGSPAALLIVDARGRIVRALPGAGPEIVWDGTDGRGSPLPAGIYWARAVRVDRRGGAAGPPTDSRALQPLELEPARIVRVR